MYKLYSIDPIKDIIENYCETNQPIKSLLDEVGGWGTGQAEEAAEILGLKCYSFNTYNDPDSTAHHSFVIQFHILTAQDDYLYDPNAILLVEKQCGGDVRGNYADVIAYKLSDGNDMSELLCELYVDPSDIEEETA